jgi:DNA mismatch repair protein MutS2
MEKREIIRILTRLTDQLRPTIPALRKATNFLGVLDFVRAKARFALKTNSNKPILTEQRALSWTQARHPILEISLRSQGKQVVPLSINLDSQKRLLLISGPNAGGKSVALKTVALLQYMLQCGLLLPVHPDSKSSLFDHFFIDIGDEQSLENDLSTYSSHLMSMKHFTQFANKKTILFIDEFGTGTEPQLGGAIEESILLSIAKLVSYWVITTHYGNLKQLADNQQGLVNGAMRYDVEKLEPLYQLEIGKPGSSFALEIAARIFSSIFCSSSKSSPLISMLIGFPVGGPADSLSTVMRTPGIPLTFSRIFSKHSAVEKSSRSLKSTNATVTFPL